MLMQLNAMVYQNCLKNECWMQTKASGDLAVPKS